MNRRDALKSIIGTAFSVIMLRDIGGARCIGGPLDGLLVKNGEGDKFVVVVWFSEAIKESFPDDLAFLPNDPGEMFTRTIYRRCDDGQLHYDKDSSHQLPEMFWGMARGAVS